MHQGRLDAPARALRLARLLLEAMTHDVMGRPADPIKLRLPNQARGFDDLRIRPGNRLEALRGDRAGRYSIRINRQWRIRFRRENGHAEDVAIVDCHDG